MKKLAFNSDKIALWFFLSVMVFGLILIGFMLLKNQFGG